MVGFFLNRVFSIMNEVEKAGFERTLSFIRGELKLYTFSYIIQKRTNELPGYENVNPMELVKNRPVNYLGEYTEEEGRHLPDGSWYFDKSLYQLVYRVKQKKAFHSSGIFATEARYRVKFFYLDNDNNKRFDLGVDESMGLGLEPQDSYSWD